MFTLSRVPWDERIVDTYKCFFGCNDGDWIGCDRYMMQVVQRGASIAYCLLLLWRIWDMGLLVARFGSLVWSQLAVASEF